jgi:broad specificity phosphatase PhoE
MTRILMIRHGQAAVSFTDDADPGLSDLGQRQASAVTENLLTGDPLLLISSPLRRAYQTAEPLRALQGGEIQIDNRVSEIPSPGLSVTERGPWLQNVMMGSWSEQSSELIDWRNALVSCLISQERDCAIFSHFVAINVAVGFAEGMDQVSVFRPDNTSVTEFQTDGNSLELVSRGSEAITTVN